MKRIHGRYVQQRVELAEPLSVPDGAQLEIMIVDVADGADLVDAGVARLEQEWDDPGI